jgi:recombinational DNA repair protein RecR
MTELFQGVKPCNTCKHYERVNYAHTCKKDKKQTKVSRLISVTCHREKKDK